jgi:poly(A) polymerase
MDDKNISSVVTGEPVILKKPAHGISRRNIDPDALRILFRLHSLKFTAYLTGGAVRDLMLGKTPKDFDIVTDARPGQIKKYFPRVFIIGRRFRLAHIHFPGGKIIEVATFRKHSSSAGPVAAQERNTQETLYGTPCEDAWRRDITINALFYDAITASVIDRSASGGSSVTPPGRDLPLMKIPSARSRLSGTSLLPAPAPACSRSFTRT